MFLSSNTLPIFTEFRYDTNGWSYLFVELLLSFDSLFDKSFGKSSLLTVLDGDLFSAVVRLSIPDVEATADELLSIVLGQFLSEVMIFLLLVYITNF